MDPKPGDLLYTHSDGFVGSAIRLGEYVHTVGWATVIADTLTRRPRPASCEGNHIAVCTGDGWVIEALARGLTRSPLSKYNDRDALVLPAVAVRPDITDTDRVRGLAFAYHELANHDGYGYLNIASIVAQLTTPTRLDLSLDGTMICSAFGARVWEHMGIVVPTRSPYTTYPSDLYVMTHAALKS